MADVNTTENKPAFEARDGSLKVVVWKNDSATDDKIYYSTKLTKTYLKDEEYCETDYLNASDLLKAQRLLNKAYDAIKDLPSKQQ